MNGKSIILKVLAVVTFLAFGEMLVQAQPLGRYTQYNFNKLLINPAYAGTIEDVTSFTSFYRKQWAGIEGAPTNIALSGNGALGKRKRVGLGVYLAGDIAGFTNQYDLMVSYAYKIPMENGSIVSAGIQGGMFYYYADLINGTTPDGVPDNALGLERAWGPNFGAGIYYYKNNKYSVGFSAPYLMNYDSPIGNDTASLRPTDARRTQYILTGSYVMDVGQELKLKPSVLVRYLPVFSNPLQVDITGSLYIRDIFMVGTSWRLDSGVKPEAGAFLCSYRSPKGLRFGYAYEYSFISKVSGYSSSHEVMVGFDIGNTSKGYLEPRFF